MADANSLTCTVYALFGSDDGHIRYIGQTKRNLKVRLGAHLSVAKRGRTRRDAWIRSVLNRGAQVLIVELRREAVWCATEVALILEYTKLGADLVNGTSGGDGVRDPSAEVRGKISAARKGQRLSAERRAEISARMKAAGIPAEHRAKMIAGVRAAYAARGQEISAALSLALTGMTFSQERCANISAAKTGYRHTEEARATMSAAQKRRMQSPEARDAISAATRDAMASEEVRARLRASARSRFELPENRQKMAEMTRKRMSRPEEKIKAARAKAKMTDEQVLEARTLAKSGVRAADLCRKYGVTSCPMSLLLRGKTFAHVPMPS